MTSAVQRTVVGLVLPGGFETSELLATGGMGSVYRGRAPDGTAVAIKIMHGEFLAHPAIRERFLREGRAVARVGHPSVPKVIADGALEDGTVYLVMELLEGETMAQRLDRRGYLLPLEVLAIADGVLEVLEVCHARDVLHRDVKPENVFLLQTGGLKLLDFGVARLRETGEQALTHAGLALGTPAFMAPEQASGDWGAVEARTDLWAVGATMFAGLTGRVVHEASSAAEELLLAATQAAPSLATVLPGVRPSVVRVVDRALKFAMSERYADAPAMRADIREAWAQCGGGDMATVWARIASDIVPSSEPRTGRIARDSKLETQVGSAEPAASAEPVSPVKPIATGWSVPPPGDDTRIAESAEFPTLKELLRSSTPPIIEASVDEPPGEVLRPEPSRARRWWIAALVVLALVLGLGWLGIR